MSRLLEMAVEEHHAQASDTVKQSKDAVYRAKRLIEETHERRKNFGLLTPRGASTEPPASPVQRARELVRRSRALRAESRKNRE